MGSNIDHNVHDADHLRQEVYREFWKQRDAQDVHAIKYFLSDGKSRLKQLEEMLGMQS